MRIKVRCWDDEAGEMIYSDKSYDLNFFEFDNGVLKCYRIVEVGGNEFEPPEATSEEIKNEPEMFIGLTDKNGKEIFKGDVWKDKHGFLWTVFWSDEFVCWALDRIDKREEPYGATKLYSINFLGEGEIIGNIHENPELIDKPQKIN